MCFLYIRDVCVSLPVELTSCSPLSPSLQTNFNTVLSREKMKKEQIINELRESLSKVTQQQEKDKGMLPTLGVGLQQVHIGPLQLFAI